ncbi:MAG: hypothetical protein ONB12_13465, partial [candidate division KSB1 bacterium]|nr:hypothetical protein [candidate division KSB1 bacterium]
ADWLDPAERRADGRWPETYLAQIYSAPIFRDAWAAFRYLNEKGVQPHFNVSGRIPPQFAGPDGQRLVDFDGYAEMIASMLKWARVKEGLKFSLLAPFNETDLGFPEGPKLLPEDVLPAVRAVVRRLDAAGLSDIKLILLCDSTPNLEKIAPILAESALRSRVHAFSTHTYGNGGDEDGGWWFLEKSPYARFVEAVRNSPYADAGIWMSEYGDLDQTGEVEFGIAWRSTRRLMKALADGFTCAMVWDAYDNFHKHDNAWTTYGLLAYDAETRLYLPKPRYYAAQQIFKYVRPGMVRIGITTPDFDEKQTYAVFKSPLKHLRLLAFITPDRRDLTLVGMSTIESDVRLQIDVSALSLSAEAEIIYYRTSRKEQFKKCAGATLRSGILEAVVPENSIFTLTTLK